MTKFLGISVDDTLGGDSPSDAVVSSQKALKTYIDAHSGGGGSVDIDDKSITKNSSDELQTVGVIDQRNTANAIKTWTGTKAQYDAISTKDANTIYNITDDANPFQAVLESIYPVGSIYIGTMNVCPMSALFGTWTLISSGIVKSGNIPVRGNGETVGWTDGTNYYGTVNGDGDSAYKGRLTLFSDYYGSNVSTTNPNDRSSVNGVFGITTDSSKSGMVLDTSSFSLNVNIWERTA